MLSELKTEKITVPMCAFETSAEEKIDLEVNLPDYCADIKRVLRCFADVGINSTEIAGDRISVKGEIIIRLLYVGDDGKVDCYEQTSAFSKHTDAKNMPENPVVLCDVKPLYINSRAASQRRFTVSGNMHVNFKIYSLSESEVCRSSNDKNMETKCGKITAVTNSVMGERLFDMTETLSLDEGKKAVGRVLYVCGEGENITYKSVSGKILLKGDMVLKVVYISDTKDKSIECVKHSMPISQIIEVPGVDKDYTLSVNICTKNITVTPKADSSGKNKLLDFSLKVSAFVEGTKNGEVCYVKDAFNKMYESKFTFEEQPFMLYLGAADKKKSVTNLLDLSALSPKEMLDVRVLSKEVSFVLQEREVLMKVNHIFSLIFTDEKGKIQYAERNADTVFSFDIKENCTKICAKPCVTVEGLTCTVEGDKANVKYDVSVTGSLYAVSEIKVLKEAEYEETVKSFDTEGVLTVYYSCKGERLWDIAKRYNKSEKDIKEENNLDTDVIKADMMLIV